ncbi:6-phosphofructo-2-kinase/fructose-2 [Blattella germanica]|nr:6-phosphofructo-2-kinase/fructose-2 [Blattella germanica]
MVGLPARGKTYISKKLCRYLNWIGFKTKDSAHNPILDATNSTLERRKKIQNFAEDNGYKLFFIESICTDNKIVDSNIREVKLKSPDYEGREPKEIMDDFLQRIEHYVENYVPLNDIAEPDIRYIKLINAGESIEIVRHEGPVQSRIIYYLMSLQLLPRDIYLTRHGESECNIHNIIGGDCDISPQGEKYADALFEFFENMNIPDLRVFTSRLKRTIQTAKRFTCIQERWEALNEINVVSSNTEAIRHIECGNTGICDGMTINEINEKYPELFDNRYNNKFHFRYPDGESYQDVIGRLETVIMELERESNILVVTHAAIIRCLLGYFLDIPSGINFQYFSVLYTKLVIYATILK